MQLLKEKTLERPVVLYNCEKKEPMGIFTSHKVLSRYLFGKDTNYYSQKNILRTIHNKRKIKSSKRFPFHMTLRFATEKYIEILGDNPYYTFKDYPTVDKSLLGEWHGIDKVPDSFILSKNL